MKIIMEITMIVMEIIMMLNNPENFNALLIGVFSSLVASFLFWLCSFLCKKPRVKITPGISMVTENGVVKYKMKILNHKWRRMAFDITVHIHIIYKKIRFYIKLADTPSLDKRNHKDYYWERHLSFNLMEISKDKIEKLEEDDPVRSEYINRKLSLETFYNNDRNMRFQVVIKACDAGGVVQQEIPIDYGRNELKDKIKELPFKQGSTEFLEKKKEDKIAD